MKRTKRLLSTVRAPCIVLAMLPATAMAAGNGNDSNLIPTERYTVLVLDHSGSMRGQPIEQMKDAAKKFCEVIKNDNTNPETNSTNYVAVVGFSTTPDAGAAFTQNIDELYPVIDNLRATNLTDISAALLEADRLFRETPTTRENKKIVQNIILLSDGLPETSYTGHVDGPFKDMGHWAVGQANRCYNIVVNDNKMLDNYNVYSLGFFHGMSYYDAAFCGKVLTKLQNCGFYEVQNASDLDFVFGQIGDEIINGEPIPAPKDAFNPDANTPHLVVTIACPVDVDVTVNGKTASTKDETGPVLIGNKGEYGKIVISPAAVGTTKTLTLCPGYNYTIGLSAYADGEVKITTQYVGGSSANKDKEYKLTMKKGQAITTTIFRDGTSFTTEPNEDQPTKGDTDGSHFTFVPTVTGGTVVLSKRNAEPGDWVNVYVTPDEGYKLESLTVTDMRGWPVTLREMGENAFSFTMPNARINVNPVFVKVEADDDPYSTNVPTNIPNIEGTSPNYGNMVINTAAMNYSDVNAGDWFYNNVKFCHERYLLNKTGEADGKFEPNTASTRATVWTALSRLAGRNTVTQGDNWYDRAQIWAKGKGITDGERPMDSMTREEFVTMLWRYDGNKYVQNSALGQFNDGESVSWWATEAVKWAVATGLLNGSNGSLNPQSNVTRAEVAAVLQRYVQNVH